MDSNQTWQFARYFKIPTQSIAKNFMSTVKILRGGGSKLACSHMGKPNSHYKCMHVISLCEIPSSVCLSTLERLTVSSQFPILNVGEIRTEVRYRVRSTDNGHCRLTRRDRHHLRSAHVTIKQWSRFTVLSRPIKNAILHVWCRHVRCRFFCASVLSASLSDRDVPNVTFYYSAEAE
jgi:hypothetical protein